MREVKSKTKPNKAIGRYEEARKLASSSDLHLRDTGRVVINSELMEFVREQITKTVTFTGANISLEFRTTDTLDSFLSKASVLGVRVLDLSPKIRQDLSALNKSTKILMMVNEHAKNITVTLVSNGRFVLKNNKPEVFRILNHVVHHLDLRGIDVSLITSLASMFRYNEFESINLGGLNFAYVSSMEAAFYNCDKLKWVNFEGVKFGKNKLTNLASIFASCPALEYVDIADINTDRCIHVHAAFNRCRKLKRVHIGGLDTSKCSSLGYVFNQCESLEEISIANLSIEGAKDVRSLFYGCEKLDLSKLGYLKSTTVAKANYIVDLRIMSACKLDFLTRLVYNKTLGIEQAYRNWVEDWYWYKFEYRVKNKKLSSNNLQQYFIDLLSQYIIPGKIVESQETWMQAYDYINRVIIKTTGKDLLNYRV